MDISTSCYLANGKCFGLEFTHRVQSAELHLQATVDACSCDAMLNK